jgi:hypothetical protein
MVENLVIFTLFEKYRDAPYQPECLLVQRNRPFGPVRLSDRRASLNAS